MWLTSHSVSVQSPLLNIEINGQDHLMPEGEFIVHSIWPNILVSWRYD